MKIVVSGSEGFIGKNIANYYREKGNAVIGLSRNEVGDLNLYNYEEFFSKNCVDLFIQCAGSGDVRSSFDAPLLDKMANFDLVYSSLEGLRKSGTECRYVLISSAAVYGQPKKLPISEDCELDTLSPYALHKRMAEDICLFYNNYYSFDCKIVRVFSAYGPGLKKQLFWDMYQKAMHNGRIDLFGTGCESRDYIYIDDLARAIDLVSSTTSKEVIWNVASGKESRIVDVAEIFAKRMGLSDGDISFNSVAMSGYPTNWRADITKIKKLGFETKYSIESGIEKYCEWLKNEKIDS